MVISDKKTFEELVREFYPLVVGYVSLLFSEVEAQDIAQDIFAQLWEKRSSAEFVDKSHFGAYLLKTSKSRCIDRLRKKSGNEALLSGLKRDELVWFLDNGEDLFEKIGREDLYRKVLEAADGLPQGKRDVFRLSYVSNMSSKDIAEITGLSVRTVDNYLYQALKFLRERLSPAGFVCVVMSITHFISL